MMARVDRFSGSNSIAPFKMEALRILLSISTAPKVPGRRCAAVCNEVLRHRIGLSYEAEAENVSPEQIIAEVINAVEVP